MWKVKRANLIGQTSVLYDNDCIAACGCWGIHGRKNARFTVRSFMWLNQANKNDCIAGKQFLERLWKTLFLYKVIEGHLWMNEFEWNWTFKALKHQTPKFISIYSVLVLYHVCIKPIRSSVLNCLVTLHLALWNCPVRSCNIEVRPISPFVLCAPWK